MFELYKIHDAHKTWTTDDSWFSIELYRMMHNGELPPKDDLSVTWILDLNNKFADREWFVKNVINKREDWGSLFLTLKRLSFMVADKLLEEINKTSTY